MPIEVAVGADYKYEDSVFVNAPCRCHLVIVDVDEDGFRLGGRNQTGDMVIEMEIVAASDPTQVGLHQRMYFKKTAEAAFMMTNFAIAAGIQDVDKNVITAELIKQKQDQGAYPVIDFAGTAIGKQLFGEIKWDNYRPEKPVLKINARDFHHLTSKQCISEERWPREPNFIKRSGVTMPTAAKNPGAATSATKPAGAATSPQGAPQTKAGAAAAGALAGLSALKLP